MWLLFVLSLLLVPQEALAGRPEELQALVVEAQEKMKNQLATELEAIWTECERVRVCAVVVTLFVFCWAAFFPVGNT